MSEAKTNLARTLQAPLPDEFDSLPESALTELEVLLRNALAHRSRALDEGIHASLEHTPRLLRPAVKKALGL